MEQLERQLRETNEELGKLRRQLARDYAPRTEQIRQRRRSLALVALAIAGSTFVSSTTLSRCFLAQPTGIERRICGVAFPGYGRMQAQSHQAMTTFVNLQRRVDQLEAEQKAHR